MTRSSLGRGPTAVALGVCGLALALSFTASEARSDPSPLAVRVALLEQKVRGLEGRLSALEKSSPPKSEARPVVAPPTESAVARFPISEDACDPPFSVDAKGIRRIRPECLKVGPCEPPFTVDPDGHRRPKKECL